MPAGVSFEPASSACWLYICGSCKDAMSCPVRAGGIRCSVCGSCPASVAEYRSAFIVKRYGCVFCAGCTKLCNLFLSIECDYLLV